MKKEKKSVRTVRIISKKLMNWLLSAAHSKKVCFCYDELVSFVSLELLYLLNCVSVLLLLLVMKVKVASNY
jgi:hypothetical protein